MEALTFYIVKSKDGKYFRSKGFSGYGESWVTDIQSAKVYQKIGPARTQVTFWASEYPKFGIPDIIELTVTETKVLDEGERVLKAILKKKRAIAQRRVDQAQWDYERLLRNRKDYSKQNLERAKNVVEGRKLELANIK